MAGYGARDKPSEGAVHDLWAKALVLEDPAGRKAALVTLDLCGIGRDLSLPIRKSITESPDYANYLKAYPGIEAMVSNLQNAVHVRPAVTQYPRISKEVGDSIAAVLLGEKQPADALNEAAQATDSLLGVPV